MSNVKIFIGATAEGKLKASITEGDLESQGVQTVHTTMDGVISDDAISLKAIVDGYNGVAPKKVKGFPSKPEAVQALFGLLTEIAEKHAKQTNGGTGEADIESALNEKPKKEKKAKGESKGTRGSPLAGKTWAVGPNAIKARRMTSTGIGVLALKWALEQVSFTTESYIADSNGGRFNDLQYDIDNGNIVELTGTPEEIAATAGEWAEKRKAAQAAADAEAEKKAKEAAEKKAKAEADKKAKAEKKEADAAAAKAKAEADAAAKAEAEKAAAEGAAAGEGEQAENA